MNRQDRFDFFQAFENPLLNITMKLEVPNFLPYCRKQQVPPFHFFLYHIVKSLHGIENFRYRFFDGKIITVDRLEASYTAMGADHLFNFTRLEYSPELAEFIRRSVAAKKEVETETGLINTGISLPPRQLKDFIFFTCLPWLDFTAIEHPVYKYKTNDIPAIAWGKFTETNQTLALPFSVQAHHGFVDAYHMHLLAEAIKSSLEETLK